MRSTATDITVLDGTDYTDSQFYADLKRNSDALNRLEAEALAQHQAGLTVEFPPTRTATTACGFLPPR